MSTPEATVLVIDDEPGIVRLCVRLLEKAGFKVDSVTAPGEGIAILKKSQIDLLLVDIRMPEMDGFEVMAQARQHQPDLAVVIMTGFGTIETAMQALREGADGLILKPFSEGEELVKAVRGALQESQQKREMARLQAIRPMLDMTEALFSETRPDRLMDLILNAICGHLRCTHAGYYRRKVGEDRLELAASRGTPLPEEDSRPEGGPLARADVWKVPIAVNLDGPGDPALQEILTEHELGSVMCAPVSRHEDSSVLMAGRDPGEPVFGASDLDLFGILARQAAVALENARLYDELRSFVRQVEDSQRALLQAEKMAAVGRLTASIAHEVNNPLQSVRNCLHLVGREELSEEERLNYLDMAQDELERLMNTVQRMLDFYRPGVAHRKPTDVNELVQRVLALMQQQLIHQQIEVQTDLAEELPLVVVVSNQLQQVLFNLILNAMGVMPEGGEIFIESKIGKQGVEIYVEDTGPGVAPEIREHLFEPFTSAREDGTGLGLSVSYGILTAHGGSLDLVPGRGKGARFRVTLPVKEAV